MTLFSNFKYYHLAKSVPCLWLSAIETAHASFSVSLCKLWFTSQEEGTVLEAVEVIVLQQICGKRKIEVAVACIEPEVAAALASECKFLFHLLSSTRSCSKSPQLVTIFWVKKKMWRNSSLLMVEKKQITVWWTAYAPFCFCYELSCLWRGGQLSLPALSWAPAAKSAQACLTVPLEFSCPTLHGICCYWQGRWHWFF